MLTAIAALLLSAAPPTPDPDPEQTPTPPSVRHIRTDIEDGHTILVYEVTNRAKKSISFYGYGGMKEYRGGEGIRPRHRIQGRKKGGAWRETPAHAFRASGQGWKALAPGAKVTFQVYAYDAWELVRGGFVWHTQAGGQGTAQTVWGGEIDPRLRFPRRPAR